MTKPESSLTEQQPEAQKKIRDRVLCVFFILIIIGSFLFIIEILKEPAFTPHKPKMTAEDIERKLPSLLVLRLGNNKIATTSLRKGKSFDFVNDGFLRKTAWITNKDAVLVKDIKKETKMLRGENIFSSDTVCSGPTSGFAFLKEFDSNNDNIIDENDAKFAELKLWTNSKSTNYIKPEELPTLADMNIAKIYLDYENTFIKDSNENYIIRTSKYETTDGKTNELAEIFLQADYMETIDTDTTPIPMEIRKRYPRISSSGNFHSLQTAIVLDKSKRLQKAIDSFYATTNCHEKQKQIDDIVYLMTGVYDIDPESRNSPVSGNVMGDARKLAAVEKIVGKQFCGSAEDGTKSPNPNQFAVEYLLKAYNSYREHVYLILSMYPLQDILSFIDLNNKSPKDWDKMLDEFIHFIEEGYTKDKKHVKCILSDFYKFSEMFQSEEERNIITTKMQSYTNENSPELAELINSFGKIELSENHDEEQ